MLLLCIRSLIQGCGEMSSVQHFVLFQALRKSREWINRLSSLPEFTTTPSSAKPTTTMKWFTWYMEKP
jgi:hypothetical protein